jgi:hypothetical protein
VFVRIKSTQISGIKWRGNNVKRSQRRKEIKARKGKKRKEYLLV